MKATKTEAMQLRFHKKLYRLSAIRRALHDFEESAPMTVHPHGAARYHVVDLESSDQTLADNLASRILMYSILEKRR